jgi:hypothetical protein
MQSKAAISYSAKTAHIPLLANVIQVHWTVVF